MVLELEQEQEPQFQMSSVKRIIIRDSSTKAVACTQINIQPEDGTREIIIRDYRKNRTLAQNNLMWMWLTQIANFIREEYGSVMLEEMGSVPTPEDLKDYFQRQLLGFKTYAMPGNEDYADRVRGTSDLNTAEFTEFLNRIDVYAGSELGLKLPHPEDIWYEAMGVAA